MSGSGPVVSADSHVLEPADLWTKRLPLPYRKVAPRLVDSDRWGVTLVGPGIGVAPLSEASLAGAPPARRRLGLADLAPGGWDAAARLAASDADHVAGEILYPTAALLIFRAPDPGYRRACLSAYNDWVAELCAQAPQRLFALAVLDVDDPAWAAEELDRARGNGAVGGVIPGRPPSGHYGEDRFDRLWRLAATQHLPLSVHAFTERDGDLPGASRPDAGSDAEPVAAMRLVGHAQRAIGQLSAGGVLARFPTLRMVFAEFDAGWAPYFWQRLDDVAARHPSPGGAGTAEPPSAAIRRQVSFGFQRDKVAVDLRDHFGPHGLLWGSDYPHASSAWPRSLEMLADLLAGVPGSERDAIVGGNAVTLYGLAGRIEPGRDG